MMNLNDALVSPPMLNSKKKKPIHEQFCDGYMSSKDAMGEIMDRKRQRKALRLMSKEKQYAELKLTDNWAEVARKLYADHS